MKAMYEFEYEGSRITDRAVHESDDPKILKAFISHLLRERFIEHVEGDECFSTHCGCTGNWIKLEYRWHPAVNCFTMICPKCHTGDIGYLPPRPAESNAESISRWRESCYNAIERERLKYK